MDNSYESFNLENTLFDEVMNLNIEENLKETATDSVPFTTDSLMTDLLGTPNEVIHQTEEISILNFDTENESFDEVFFSAYCHELLTECTQNSSIDDYVQPASSVENAATNIDYIEVVQTDLMQISPTLVLPEKVNTAELISDYLQPSEATAESLAQFSDIYCSQTEEIPFESFQIPNEGEGASSSGYNDLDLDALLQEPLQNYEFQPATTNDDNYNNFSTANQLYQSMMYSSSGVFENHEPATVSPYVAIELPEQTTTIPIQISVKIQQNSSDYNTSPYQAIWSFNCSSSLVTPESNQNIERQQQIAPQKRKYTRRTDDCSKAKKQKLNENVDPNLIIAIASNIPKYRIVKESEMDWIEKRLLRPCLLTVPYEPYPFEPELLLCHVNGTKFAYRFDTKEDPNTNTRFCDQKGSEIPELPQFWCLQCGISFSRPWSSRRHSSRIHKVEKPVYKRVYITQTPY